MLRQFWTIVFLGLFSVASANAFTVYNYNNPEEPVVEEDDDESSSSSSSSSSGGSTGAPRKPVSGPVTPSRSIQGD